MKCFECKADIEDDSLFCDQCGAKIYLCPDCRVPGKGEGKRCGLCGKKLVAADALTSGNSPQDAGQTVQEPPRAQCPTRLVCRSERITLNLQNGAVLGRLEGPYQRDLGRLEYISARHAQVWQEADHWILSDLGSRNGSAVNGQWCYNPLPFRTGDTVRLANYYDFIAE
jgi:hypothetical protein